MTWRLQAELPLRLAYTPKSSVGVNWPNYSSRRHKRPMSYIKTKRSEHKPGIGTCWVSKVWQLSSKSQWLHRVTERPNATRSQCAHADCPDLLSQLCTAVWKLSRSTLTLSQQRLTLTFYWGGGRGDRQWTVPYSTQRESLTFESTRIWEINEPVSVFVGSMDQEGSGVFSPFAGIYVRN